MTPSGFSTNVGVMLESGRLPGAIAFASAPSEPKAVRHARLGREIVHLVVQHHARARNHQARAKEKVDGQRAGDTIALGIEHRKVRGLRARLGAGDARQRVAGGRAIQADRGALTRRVVRVGRAARSAWTRNRDRPVLGAIAMHAAHRFDDEMLARRTVEARRS